MFPVNSRRLLLAALALCCAAACTAPIPTLPTTAEPTSQVPSPSSSVAEAGAEASPSSSPPEVPTATPTLATDPPPPSAPAIDPDAVAARFADHAPTAWGLEVPGVLTDQPDSTGVALTLDGCGGAHGSGVDRALLDGLTERNVPATLFLNARWLEANPDLAIKLAANPLFELANHGTSHKPLSVTGEKAYGIAGTTSAAEAVAEVWTNHERITALTGTPPRWFRSGTAHYDDVASQIVTALGEQVVGFTINGDGGATLSATQVEREVLAAGPGDVVIAHLNQPDGGTAEGLLAAVDRMLAAGAQFTLLD